MYILARQWVPRALLVAQIVVLLLIARNWAYVTTYRLFLDRRVGADGSAAAQQFDIEGSRVVPLIVTRGPTWVDPRVVRDLPFRPHAAALALLMSCWLTWSRRASGDWRASFGDRTRVAVFKVAAATLSLATALLASEAALRALGELTPSGIASERHDLGEVTRDVRWIDSSRYGRRLRANVDALNEWRHGDIVRLGYIPTPAGEGALHRFTFQTDAEGFRNHAVREKFDIAALGDSFTDAMTMAAEASWPAGLERRLGVPVQNYGTAGFGPQQELLVLKDFVARHRPRVVVLAFFAGNDLFDAEAFDAFQRSGGTQQRTVQGWRIKDVISRADTWFVVSALRAGGRWMRGPQQVVEAAMNAERPVGTTGSEGRPPLFDRGMFDVPIADRRLPFALMPPYLNTLNFSGGELEARPGWRFTRDAIAEMRTVSQSFGATFVVMFVPFKSQVYLPLVERAFATEDLRSAFRFYLEAYGREVDVDRLRTNRLAQNRLMQRFCAEAGIPFVDTTAALEARVEAGENMYFPDESHLNEAGEAILADTLATFLAERARDPKLSAKR